MKRHRVGQLTTRYNKTTGPETIRYAQDRPKSRFHQTSSISHKHLQWAKYVNYYSYKHIHNKLPVHLYTDQCYIVRPLECKKRNQSISYINRPETLITPKKKRRKIRRDP